MKDAMDKPYAIRWLAATKNDRLVQKARSFDTEAELDRFFTKLQERDDFVEVIAYDTPPATR